MTTALPHALDRDVLIRAQRATVFRYFTDTARFAAWWGTGSEIDPRPGGAVLIRYPNGVEAGGEVLEIAPERRIVFTYGYRDPAKPIAWGASRVTIALEDRADGTLVRLRHEFTEAGALDQHVPGWWYQLAVFAHVVANEQHAGVLAHADAWFAAWTTDDAAERERQLAACTTPGVEFRDAHGCVRGQGELLAHIAAVRRHFPGVALVRAGEPRQAHGCALVGWELRKGDGAAVARGTNVFDLAPDGRIQRAVGIWG
jgi:uncharacterized protein YndB with AHSA1/START domain